MSLDMGRLPLRRDHPLGRSAKREAGLRTSGSTPIHPAFPARRPVAALTRLGGRFPVTAAGPCRTHTGFPILPTTAGQLANVVPVATLPTGPSPVGTGNWVWQFQPRVRAVPKPISDTADGPGGFLGPACNRKPTTSTTSSTSTESPPRYAAGS